MIAIRSATRRYGSFTAVDDVSLDIERGEVVGLLGHNGAGKTTLMRMLTGVLEPTSGSLAVNTKDLVSDRSSAQSHIGYLPESAPLYPEMEVFEYLVLMAELRGVPADRRASAAMDAAVATGLQKRLDDPIRTLSKGFRQRVGIAQAIVHSPDVLVLDEPTNGLDPVQILAIRKLIQSLAERTTIILSTHILQEVEAVCDRVVILIGGQVVQDASLGDLLKSNALLLSVADGTTGVEAALHGLDGVQSVDPLGPDAANPGYRRWAIRCAGDASLAPAVLDKAQQNGWTVAAIGREQKTLEGVFKDLQYAHAARSQKEVA